MQYLISKKIGPTDLLHPFPAPHFKTFQVFLTHIYRSIWRNMPAAWIFISWRQERTRLQFESCPLNSH